MLHAGRPVPHHRLLTSIWGPEYGNEREYLRVLINPLRKKIEDDPARPLYILTEIGYRFRERKFQLVRATLSVAFARRARLQPRR